MINIEQNHDPETLVNMIFDGISMRINADDYTNRSLIRICQAAAWSDSKIVVTAAAALHKKVVDQADNGGDVIFDFS